MKKINKIEEKENLINQLKIDLISRFHPLSNKKVIKHKSVLNFDRYALMNNEHINWDIELIKLVKDKIDSSAFWKLKNIKFDLTFFDEFKNRGEQGLNWFNLRSCSYIDYFEQPKIIYADIVQDRGKFYYDTEKFYTNDTAFIISGDGIKPLTALLNSSLVSYIYKTFYSGGGLGDKGIRFKKEFLGKVPIAKSFNEEFMSLFVDVLQHLKNNNTAQINDIVKNDHIAQFFEEVIDGCVFELYFEEHMKEKGINIIDDVKKYIDESGLNQDFENSVDEIKKQKIWELYKTMSTGIVQVKMTDFITKSPDILKPILQS